MRSLLTRASALFLTPAQQEHAHTVIDDAYTARSLYVHGKVIKNQTEREKQEELRTLRRLTLQIMLRWLVLTPSDTDDLAPLLAAAAQGTGREEHIGRPLRAFFTTTPPSSQPADITAT
ncbi:hypothetical protein OG206_32435 [Streptomyces sp. NBC_01341]|uniref:hypothetical protein n=1 Tax=Streptomyces sp. NBC_01341 TaxID=2903831 RepID=UPI002E14FBBA|nr:hypothetical protein OG206_32435 [Streptomyces sp. NBC_01341]